MIKQIISILIAIVMVISIYLGYKKYNRYKRYSWRHDLCDLIDNDPSGMKWMACEQAKSGCPYKYQNGSIFLQTYIDANGKEYCTNEYGEPIKGK